MSHGPGLLFRTHFPQLSPRLAETGNLGENRTIVRLSHLHFPAWHPIDSSVCGPERGMEVFLGGLGCSGKKEQCPLQLRQCHLYRKEEALGSHLPDGGSGTPHARDKAPSKRSLRAALMSEVPHSWPQNLPWDSWASPALSKTLILSGDLHQHQKVGKKTEGENKAMA